MIVARSPLRISFLGGGTDNSEFINRFGFGIVLGTTINRYVYVFLDDQPSFEKNKYKFAYRTVEEVDKPQDFMHPVVKSMISDLRIERPLNIATMANLPGRSGLGSSSAFTVSLYAALLRLQGKDINPIEVAKYAIYCERVLMSESGGFQDQYHAAIGGFRSYKFEKNQVSISEPLLKDSDLRYLEKCIVLIATISSRESRVHAEEWNKKLSQNRETEHVFQMQELCESAIKELRNATSEEKVRDTLIAATREGWNRKKAYIPYIDSEVNQIIEHGLSNGAEAAKLCGAGGSGFVLFIAKPENLRKLQNAFPPSQVVLPLFENCGVIVNEV